LPLVYYMRGGKKIALSEPYKHTARQGYNGKIKP
jgi:hypothetical protein